MSQSKPVNFGRNNTDRDESSWAQSEACDYERFLGDWIKRIPRDQCRRFPDRGGSRKGFFFPLVILGVLSMLFLAFSLNFLGTSYSQQVQHVDEGSRTLMVAESRLSMLLAELREKPYSQRVFASKPLEEYDQKLLGGKFDLFVENALPPAVNQADIYIRATFGKAKRLYFWRIRYEDSLLDAAGRVIPIIFTVLDPGRFPTPSGSPFSGMIKDIITKRRENEAKAQEKGFQALKDPSLKNILADSKAFPPGQNPDVLDLPAAPPEVPSEIPTTVPNPTTTPASPPSVLKASDFFAHFTQPAEGYPGKRWTVPQAISPDGNKDWDQIAIKCRFKKVPAGMSDTYWFYARVKLPRDPSEPDDAESEYVPFAEMGLDSDGDGNHDLEPYSLAFPSPDWEGGELEEPISRFTFEYLLGKRPKALYGLRCPECPTKTIGEDHPPHLEPL